MDTAATSLAQYTYQNTLQSSGPSAGALQAMGQAYTAAAAANGTDPLASLAGASAVAPLASGITTLTQAANPGQALASTPTAPALGGLDLNSGTSLLASLGSASEGTSGLQGQAAAANSGATLTATGYLARQAYASAASLTPAAVSAIQADNTNQPGNLVSAVAGTAAAITAAAQQTPAFLNQAFQASTDPSILSLLA